MKETYDCVVIGAGPAGCTSAALIAEAGYSTLLVEREKVPRFHVGESLMPETYWVFQRLGVLEQMKSSDFVKKRSVQFVSHSGKESAPFFFDKHDPRECSQTWQVERGRFDKMLFDNANRLGADTYDETRVMDVHFDGDRATGVTVRRDGEARQIAARTVIDATGLQAFIPNRLGLIVDNPDLQKIAIWSYYRDATRDEGKNLGATIILHTDAKESWFWFIPLADGITSIGVVGDRDYMLKGRGKPPQVFADELMKCSAMQRRLANATQSEDFHVAKEFSYSTTRRSGEGWVLVGDAYGFIDPIYSTGVFFALRTGELAADAIVEGFQKNDLSASQLGCWTKDFDEGVKWIRKLVGAYYTNEFSFGRFLKTNMQHVGNLTDLLIGRIFYDGAGDIFDDMDQAIEQSIRDRVSGRDM
jgi:flavin-dependent dehydrogenase